MSEKPEQVTLKQVIDNEKPYFDYAAYILRIAAWFVAVVYVARQNLRPTPSDDWFFKGTTWISVAMFAGFGIFLVYRLMWVSIGVIRALAPSLEVETFRNRIFRALLVFWLLFGTPAFVVAFVGELIEQFIESAPDRHPVSASPRKAVSEP